MIVNYDNYTKYKNEFRKIIIRESKKDLKSNFRDFEVIFNHLLTLTNAHGRICESGRIKPLSNSELNFKESTEDKIKEIGNQLGVVFYFTDGKAHYTVKMKGKIQDWFIPQL